MDGLDKIHLQRLMAAAAMEKLRAARVYLSNIHTLQYTYSPTHLSWLSVFRTLNQPVTQKRIQDVAAICLSLHSLCTDGHCSQVLSYKPCDLACPGIETIAYTS